MVVRVLGLVVSTVVILSSTPALAGRRTVCLRVASDPPGALVSVLSDVEAGPRVVAGVTPLEKRLDLPKAGRLVLRLERRGFVPAMVEVAATTHVIDVQLERLPDGARAGGGGPTDVTSVALLGPEITVIRRGFSRERVSEEGSADVRATVAGAIARHFHGVLEVVNLPRSGGVTSELEPFLRDARGSTAVIDPIRLPFLATAPRLETTAGRAAARLAGEMAGAQAVLLVTGTQNVETAGMKAGKVGILAAGTAASYASGFSRAATSGDAVFVYDIHIPAGSSGVLLEAILVDSRSGEVLWLNRGRYRAIHSDRPEDVDEVVTDLLTGIPPGEARLP